jgi:hypothetical protein
VGSRRENIGKKHVGLLPVARQDSMLFASVEVMVVLVAAGRAQSPPAPPSAGIFLHPAYVLARNQPSLLCFKSKSHSALSHNKQIGNSLSTSTYGHAHRAPHAMSESMCTANHRTDASVQSLRMTRTMHRLPTLAVPSIVQPEAEKGGSIWFISG